MVSRWNWRSFHHRTESLAEMSFFGYLNLNFVFFLNLFFGGEEGGRCVHCFCCHFWDVNFCWMLSLRVTRCRGANFGDAVVSCLCHSGGLGEYL